MAANLADGSRLLFLAEFAREKIEISDREALAIGCAVSGALERFANASDSYVDHERQRLETLADSLDMAFAAMLSDPARVSMFDLPFASVLEFYEWLHWPEAADEAFQAELFSTCGDPGIELFWSFVRGAREELNAYTDASEAISKERLPALSESSRLKLELQHLIGDLCGIWVEFVGELNVVNTRSPDGPLLRFLDRALSEAMGAKRPGKGTVRNFIRTAIRPGQTKSEQDNNQSEMEFSDAIFSEFSIVTD